jgi:hypothetical protein
MDDMDELASRNCRRAMRRGECDMRVGAQESEELFNAIAGLLQIDDDLVE